MKEGMIPKDNMEVLEEAHLGDEARHIKVAVVSKESDGEINVKEIEGRAVMAVTTDGNGQHTCVMIGGMTDNLGCVLSLLQGMAGRIEAIAQEDFIDAMMFANGLQREITKMMTQMMLGIIGAGSHDN